MAGPFSLPAAFALGFVLGIAIWRSGAFNRGDGWQAAVLISIAGPFLAGFLLRWTAGIRLAMAAGALTPLALLLLYILLFVPEGGIG